MTNNEVDSNIQDSIIASSALNTSIEDTNLENNNDKKETDFSIPTTFDDYLTLSKNFYAGFWQRLVAYLIDLAVVYAVAALLNTFSFNMLNAVLDIPVLGETTISFLLVGVLYFVLMTYYFSQTLGKIIMKIKVEPNKGGKLTFVEVLYREIIGRFLNILLVYLPYLVLVFTDKKKGLHDYIADTVVVKEDFSDLRRKMNEKIEQRSK